jgi:Rieske Fe-S protein
MRNRRNFLKDVCPTVAFAFFGISFLEACSSGDEDVDVSTPDLGNGNGTNGFSVDGNTYTIDLTHSNFTNPPSNMGTGLNNVGGWMNGKSLGIPALFLRLSSTSVQAYTNVCPHNLKDDKWELINNGNTFRCKWHGSTYETDKCPSGELTCYNPELDGNTLTLIIS